MAAVLTRQAGTCFATAGRLGNLHPSITPYESLEAAAGELVVERLRTRPAADWLGRLKAAGIPCGAVRDLEQVFTDPQIVERAMVMALDRPIAGAIRQRGVTVKPRAVRTHPPTLGQHTDAVLRDDLGLSGRAR